LTRRRRDKLEIEKRNEFITDLADERRKASRAAGSLE
jgi:hypothetical protein